MVALKALIVCALLGFSAAIRFEQAQADEASNLLNTLLNDIKDERERDNEQVVQAKNTLALAKQAMDTAEASWKYAVNAMEIAQKNLQNQQGHLTVLKNDYAAAKSIRTEEQSAIAKLASEVDDLNRIGGTAKQIGTLDAVPAFTPSADLQFAVDNLHAASIRKPLIQQVLIQLARGDVSLGDIKGNLGNMDSKVSTEEVEDKSRVTAQQAVVDAATEVFTRKQAIEIAKKSTYDTCIIEHQIATQQLAYTQAEFEKADATRKADEDVLSQMKTKLTDLVNVRALTADIQEQRTSAATDRLGNLLIEMLQYTQEEEDNQLQLVNELKATMEKKAEIMRTKEALYKQAVEYTLVKLKAMEAAKTALEAAMRDLAIERSTAVQERRMVSSLRATIAKFKALKLQSGGKCPIVDGSYCAAAGSCVKDVCQCNDGHIGDDCATCAFGYTMKNRVCVLVALQEEQRLGDYGMDEINSMLLQVQRDYSQTAGVETLLNGLIDKLDENQRNLEAALAKRQQEYDAAVLAYNDAKMREAAAKIAFDKATEDWKKAKAEYDQIQALYDAEHPLRMTEMGMIRNLQDFLVQLTGNETYKMVKFTRPPNAPPVPKA